jgi:hypothetical protein
MPSRNFAALAAVLVVALPIAGCGDDKSNRDAAYKAPETTPATAANPADAAEAKSAARAAASAVESCFVDSMDYSQCKSAKVLSAAGAGVEPGSDPGQVEVTEATASTYKIEAHAEGGAVFAIEKAASGEMKRTCSGPGCEGGSW